MRGKPSRCFTSLPLVPSCPGAFDSLTPFSAPTGKSTLTKSPGDGKLGGMASAGGQSQHSEWSWQRHIWKKHVGLAEDERKVLQGITRTAAQSVAALQQRGWVTADSQISQCWGEYKKPMWNEYEAAEALMWEVLRY